MKKFKVEITETLQKTVEVEADNKEDAMHKVMKMYKNTTQGKLIPWGILLFNKLDQSFSYSTGWTYISFIIYSRNSRRLIIFLLTFRTYLIQIHTIT